MRSMDTPPSRPLPDDPDPAEEARVRPGVPDGRPRSPAELLDNLRLRLSELPPNHPSAPRAAGRVEPSDRARPSGRPAPADQPAPPGEPEPSGQAEPPGQRAPDERAAADGARRPEGSGDSRGPQPDDADGPGLVGEAIRAARMAGGALASTADASGQAMMNLADQVSPSDAYRPWFMSGEPGAPWWAADNDMRD